MIGSDMVIRNDRVWLTPAEDFIRLLVDAQQAAEALAASLAPDDLLGVSLAALSGACERRIERTGGA
jgi:hypothetical protein